MQCCCFIRDFLVVPQSGDLCLEEVVKCKLSPHPPSLFEGKNLLQKLDKAPLLHAVRSHETSSNDAILLVFPKTAQYVLEGCSLIHRLTWTDGSPYNLIADVCVSHCRNVSMQIDNYHRRRHRHVGLAALSCSNERLQGSLRSVRQGETKCIKHNGPEMFSW